MTHPFTIDVADYAGGTPNRPFAIKHQLAGDPLFSLDNLIALATEIDRDRVEYSSGKVEPNQAAGDTPKVDLSITETLQQIEDCHAWMVIKNVETVPRYKDFLDRYLREIAERTGLDGGAMTDFQGFIFVSSAKSVTPFHVDAEQNFLIQIRGAKTVHIFDNDDRSLVSDKDMEISPANHRNRDYSPEFEARAEIFEIMPGDGVYIPYLAPHWVETGDDYCISIAVTWKTPEIRFNNDVLAANALCRKFGMPQSPPGTQPTWDMLKVLAFRAARAMINPLRKSEAMRRILRRLIFGRKANYYYETGPG